MCIRDSLCFIVRHGLIVVSRLGKGDLAGPGLRLCFRTSLRLSTTRMSLVASYEEWCILAGLRSFESARTGVAATFQNLPQRGPQKLVNGAEELFQYPPAAYCDRIGPYKGECLQKCSTNGREEGKEERGEKEEGKKMSALWQPCIDECLVRSGERASERGRENERDAI
eukprot:2534123-Rhodomonas_salina.1